jgi:hypothetical protein
LDRTMWLVSAFGFVFTVYIFLAGWYEHCVLGPRPPVTPWGPTGVIDWMADVIFLMFALVFDMHHRTAYNALIELQAKETAQPSQ